MKSQKTCRIVFKQTTKNTYLAKYYVLFFVSLSLLHISSVAARNTNYRVKILIKQTSKS